MDLGPAAVCTFSTSLVVQACVAASNRIFAGSGQQDAQEWLGTWGTLQHMGNQAISNSKQPQAAYPKVSNHNEDQSDDSQKHPKPLAESSLPQLQPFGARVCCAVPGEFWCWLYQATTQSQCLIGGCAADHPG